METAKYEKLTAAGIDVNSALERFMGNEMLLDRFLRKLLRMKLPETMRCRGSRKKRRGTDGIPHAKRCDGQFVYDRPF